MRAKCKAGINFVVESGYRVHFALDSLWSEENMHTVARKESDQPWHTGSELRYIYKNRASPRKDQISFYVKGAKVEPPWEEFPGAWNEYGNTRLDDKRHVPEGFRR